jgi:hypothetical protein
MIKLKSLSLLFAVSIAMIGFSSCDRLTDFITSKLNKNQVTKDKQASDLADKKKVGETNSDDVNTSEIPGDAGVEDSEYVGTYAGQFGNYTIQLVIEDINGSEVSGYNVVAGNRRPVRGTVSNGSFELKEPGTDKWDGVFNFVVYNGVASGEWKANNGKAVTNFSILKKG